MQTISYLYFKCIIYLSYFNLAHFNHTICYQYFLKYKNYVEYTNINFLIMKSIILHHTCIYVIKNRI